MNPDLVFARKELLEYTRTWRLRLLLIAAVFFALTGPVLAYFTPEIMRAALGSQSAAFETLPDATWRDVYQQWAKNLQQIVPFLVIVIAAGAIAGEATSGTIIPIVAGGYSRTRIVLIKFVVHGLIGIGTVIAGTLLTWAAGLVLFPDIAFAPALRVAGVASLLVVLLVSIAMLASCVMADTLGAIGVSVATFLLLAGLTFWPAARDWSPVGILPLLGSVIDGATTTVWGPVISTIIVAGGCLAVAVRAFGTRELSGA